MGTSRRHPVRGLFHLHRDPDGSPLIDDDAGEPRPLALGAVLGGPWLPSDFELGRSRASRRRTPRRANRLRRRLPPARATALPSAVLTLVVFAITFGVFRLMLLNGLGLWSFGAAFLVPILATPLSLVFLPLLAPLSRRTLSRQDAAHLIRHRLARRRCGACGERLPRATHPHPPDPISCTACAARWDRRKWTRDRSRSTVKPPRSRGRRTAGHLIDDRGQARWMVVSAPELRRARSSRNPASFLPEALATLSAVVLTGLARRTDHAEGQTGLTSFIFWLSVPGIVGVHFIARRERRRRALRARRRREDACPACASPLRLECSLIDGCRLCDACGAAWRDPDPPFPDPTSNPAPTNSFAEG